MGSAHDRPWSLPAPRARWGGRVARGDRGYALYLLSVAACRADELSPAVLGRCAPTRSSTAWTSRGSANCGHRAPAGRVREAWFRCVGCAGPVVRVMPRRDVSKQTEGAVCGCCAGQPRETRAPVDTAVKLPSHATALARASGGGRVAGQCSAPPRATKSRGEQTLPIEPWFKQRKGSRPKCRLT